MKPLASVLLCVWILLTGRRPRSHTKPPQSAMLRDLQTFPKRKTANRPALSRRTNRPALISLRWWRRLKQHQMPIGLALCRGRWGCIGRLFRPQTQTEEHRGVAPAYTSCLHTPSVGRSPTFLTSPPLILSIHIYPPFDTLLQRHTATQQPVQDGEDIHI